MVVGAGVVVGGGVVVGASVGAHLEANVFGRESKFEVFPLKEDCFGDVFRTFFDALFVDGGTERNHHALGGLQSEARDFAKSEIGVHNGELVDGLEKGANVVGESTVCGIWQGSAQ